MLGGGGDLRGDLVEEVLQRQPERVRSFLLQTSILDRLSGPLCDAVTGREDGKAQKSPKSLILASFTNIYENPLIFREIH